MTAPIHDPTIDAGWINDPGAVNAIGDTTWIDTNGDGIQDPGELPLGGVIVELIDPLTGAVLAATITNVDGEYEFTNLPDGEYQVRFTLDADNPAHNTLVRTLSDSGDNDEDDSDADRFTGMTGIIALDPDGIEDQAVEDRTVEAGFTPPGTIGDRVWHDQDTDGRQDPDENGIPDVVVELWAPGPDGEFGGEDDELIRSTTTDEDGNYVFDELPPGPYVIRFDPSTLPEGWTPSTTRDSCGCPFYDNDADADGWTSAITLDPNEDIVDIDFGASSPTDITRSNQPGGPLAFTGRNATINMSIAAGLLLLLGALLLGGERLARKEEEHVI